MILSQLKSAHGRKKKRLGQGKASGKGGTSTKGHKGQKARSGVKIARGFEGGQMSLVRRLPKFGFSNQLFKRTYDVVNLNQLNQFEGEVLLKDMIERHWVGKKNLVKILGKGNLKKSLKVSAHQFSKKARQEIEKQGGQALYIEKKKK